MKLWNKDFAFLCISNFFIAFAFYSLLAVLPLYLRQQLAIPGNEIGIILSAYTLGALLIRPLSGFAFDQFNKLKILLYSVLIFAVLFTLYSWINSFESLIILRLIQGFSWGILTTGMVTISIEVIPVDRRGEGIGLLGISMTLAMALAPPVAVWLITLVGFIYLFWMSTLLAFIAFVALLWVRLKQEKHKNVVRTNFQFFSKEALPVSLSMMLVCIGYGAIMSFITLYAQSIGIAQPGRFFIFLAFGLLVTRFFSGRIFDRYGPYWISFAGFLLIIVGFTLLGFAESNLLFLTSATLTGLGFGSLIPSTQTMINNLVPAHKRGAGNSTFLTFFDLGIGGGMLLTGIIAQKTGYKMAYFLSAAISLLSMLFYFAFVYQHYRKNKI